MAKRRFSRISSDCFEHPADRAALKALKSTAGFDRLVRFVMGLGLEPVVDYQNRSSYVLCGPQQCAPLYELYREAAEVLDVSPIPPLYLAHSVHVNAWTFGSEKPYVVVTSGLVEGFADAEVQCVMGHELGHVLAGHALYRTTGNILLSLLQRAATFAGGVVALPTWLVSRGLVSAFMYWGRSAELTADRAGLLVTQDREVSYSTALKLASGPGAKIAAQLSIDAFLAQARSFERDPKLNSKLLRFMLEDARSHPYPVVRLRELEMWLESGAYESIYEGGYSRRGQTLEAVDPSIPTDAQDELLRDVITSSLSRVYGVHTAPKIPQESLARAAEDFASCGDDERVVALYDGGFGGGDGLALTTRRLLSAARPHIGLPYTRIEQLKPVAGGLLSAPSLELNGGELKLGFHRSEVRDGMLDAIEAARRVALASADDGVTSS